VRYFEEFLAKKEGDLKTKNIICETLISEGYCHRMLQNFVVAISCGRRAEEIIIGSHGEDSL
jgi:hypothetical protein